MHLSEEDFIGEDVVEAGEAMSSGDAIDLILMNTIEFAGNLDPVAAAEDECFFPCTKVRDHVPVAVPVYGPPLGSEAANLRPFDIS